ncbi:MAG TPA: TonB-dependent receptor [Terracidiphilus sp.]|nr:TonB-dependent receptor [Terracidiphilus sp.]
MRLKALSLAAALFSLCGMAFAQTITGNINGRVTDPSGAVVPGAQVTATNVSTNVSTSTVTNKDGLYSLRFLPVGQYAVTFEASGFNRTVMPGITLEVAQTVEVDASLKIGSTATSVRVEAGTTPILNTSDGTVTTTISQTLVNDLPINGHNFTELTQMVPGSTVADGNQWNGAGQSSPDNSGERVQSFATLPNVNGNRTYTTNFTLDGVSIVDTGANLANGFGTPAYNIAPEMVQEVTIIANVPPAEYGDGATQIAAVTKSGTETYHGSASGYLQNYLLDANLFQNKRVLPGQPFTPRTDYTQSIYTGTFGGPVPLLRKKLFFFSDYEAYRKPAGGFSKINVPLNAWRGNTSAASGSPDTSVSPLAGYAYFGSAVPQLYDSQNGFAPFNQTVNGVLYQNLVPIRNPVAKLLFSTPGLLPLPNAAASTAPVTGNYQGVIKSLTRNDQGDVKVDWTPTDRDRISGRWSEGEADDGTRIAIDPVSFPTINDFPFKQIALFYTRTISTSIVNEARAGFTRMHYNSYPLDLSGKFSSGESTVGIPWSNAVPGFSLQHFAESTNSTGISDFGTSGSANLALDNQFSYGDNLTWQHGRHITKFGAQLFRIQNNFYQNNSGGLLGSFNYSGAFTGNPKVGQSVGYDFADFLLDYSSSYAVSLQTGDVGLRQYRFGVFAQDDFKVTPNLTVNYGLRWEYDQPLYEVNNKISDINPTTGALEVAGVNGVSRSIYSPTWDDFDPRLGFAWNPDLLNKKLVIRGGLGVTSYMDYNLIHNHVGNAPFHVGVSATANTPTTTATGSPFAVTNGFGASGASITGVSFNVWNKLKPMMEPQYSLVTEYAINGKQSVSLAYVGNVAQHLGDVRNINQETLVGTPSSAAFNTTTVATSTGTSVTVGTSSVQLYESEAYSNFNAGEATYRLRPTYGLEFQLNYTYSHALGDTSGPIAVNDNNVAGGDPQNNFCLRCEYGPSASDSRHMLSSDWVYQLPFGRGKQFGAGVATWLDEVIGGWTVSGSAVLFSGQPNTITANGSSGAIGAGTLRANHYRTMVRKGGVDGWYQTSGGGSYAPNPGLDGKTSAGFTYVIAGEWGTDPSATHSGNVGAGTCGTSGYDDGVCAYGQPAVSATGGAPTFGTASVGTERAQGFRQVDSSLQKAWRLHEAHQLIFIANAYNVGNIVSYNNQGRTTGGGSTWGFVQSTRSEPRQIELELKYQF